MESENRTTVSRIQQDANKNIARTMIRELRTMLTSLNGLIKKYDITGNAIRPIINTINAIVPKDSSTPSTIPAKDIYPILTSEFDRCDAIIRSYEYSEDWFWEQNVGFKFNANTYITFNHVEDNILSSIPDEKERKKNLTYFQRSILVIFNCVCRSEGMIDAVLVYDNLIKQLNERIGLVRPVTDNSGTRPSATEGISDLLQVGTQLVKSIRNTVGDETLTNVVTMVRDSNFEGIKQMTEDPQLRERLANSDSPLIKELTEAVLQ